MGAADTKANLGPARRGHACVAAQDGRVVVCFGYTTYDECTGLPTMQPMRDTWTCQILSEQAAESFIPLQPDAPRSGAVRPNEALVTHLDFDDFRVMHQHARTHVLRDMELRKQLSNLCPSDNGQRGALLTVLLDGTEGRRCRQKRSTHHRFAYGSLRPTSIDCCLGWATLIPSSRPQSRSSTSRSASSFSTSSTGESSTPSTIYSAA